MICISASFFRMIYIFLIEKENVQVMSVKTLVILNKTSIDGEPVNFLVRWQGVYIYHIKLSCTWFFFLFGL
jgi:hypothetical protein